MTGSGIVVLLAVLSGASDYPEEPAEVEGGLIFGVSSGVRPGANGGESTGNGLAIGLFAASRWSRIEVLVARHFLEIVQLTPIASRRRGNVRPGLYAGVTLGIGLEARVSTLFRYHIGVVVGAGVAIGRSSIEVRYRHGLLHYGYFTAPGLDIGARSLTGLVGFRL